MEPTHRDSIMEGVTYQFSEDAMLTIRVAGSMLQFIGILLSFFRLWFRWRIRRLWWEDACALIACVFVSVTLVAEWTYLNGGWEASVVSFWICTLGFTLITWAVRASILFSVARLVHTSEKMRRMMTAIASLFGAMFLSIMILKIWGYAANPTWAKQAPNYPLPSAWLPNSTYIYQACTECISDSILVALPVRMLWNMNLPMHQRRMIIAIFSSSVIVTAVSMFRAISQVMRLASLVGLATEVEVALSIITCNLLVVTTVVYRLCQRRHVPEPADDDYTTPRPTQALTTVDLSVFQEFSGGSIQASSDTEKSSCPPRV